MRAAVCMTIIITAASSATAYSHLKRKWFVPRKRKGPIRPIRTLRSYRDLNLGAVIIRATSIRN